MTDQEDFERQVYDQENDPAWPEPNPEPAEEDQSHPEVIPHDDTAAEASPDPQP